MMATYAVWIALWLLSGFLAAWIGHRFVDDKKYNTKLLEVLVMTALGGVTLAAAIMALLHKQYPTFYSYVTNTEVFKAKEPK